MSIEQKFRDRAFQFIEKRYKGGFFNRPETEECFAKIGIEMKEARKIMAGWRKEGREKARRMTENWARQRAEANHEN